MALVGGAVATGQRLELNPQWTEPGVAIILGKFAAQLFGNALYEELVFRGFLLPQLYLKFSHNVRISRKMALLLAVLVSQIYFSIIHIPVRLYKGGDLAVYLTGVALLGILFALLYIRTENIFIGVGLHTLFNSPVALFTPSFEPGIIFFLFLIFVILLKPSLKSTP